MQQSKNTASKMQLTEINELITCKICKGYFIDATTIIECLHTFCRSCIVKHFKKSLFCPECDVQVERGCPLNKLRPDPRKQLIVYKLVPKLHQNEIARQWNFLKKYKPKTPFSHPHPSTHHSGPRPLLPGDLPEEETIRDRIVDKIHLYCADDKFSVSLEYESPVRSCPVKRDIKVETNGCDDTDDKDNRHRRYLQCPAGVTVQHLKKFIRMKYEISAKVKIIICYEGDEVTDNSTMMDIAYQFFYEAKAPMRFTYRFINVSPVKTEPKPAAVRNPAPNWPSMSPVVLVTPISMAQLTPTLASPTPATTAMRQPSTPAETGAQYSARGTASANSSSDESSANRRQQRRRSAKTAAYTAIGAMEEESDHDDETLPKRKRMVAKSPRWENDADSYTVYRNTRRTPKTSLEDFEARYNTKPAGKRVYAPCTDDESSDEETKRNTIANQKSSVYSNLLTLLKTDNSRHSFSGRAKKHRSKKADRDVYEFDAQNEDNEDSNTTQEFDFVYDNSDHDSAESDKARGQESAAQSESSEPGCSLENGHSLSDLGDDMNEADERELEKHIEMEVITDTDDIDQHIEDSIEEVEVDADDAEQSMHEDEQESLFQTGDDNGDNQMEADTTSSASLVIAEDEEDDGVVEEVIAAEEDGHKLVVVEDESDATHTVEIVSATTPSFDGSERNSDASRSPQNSMSSKSPTVEEDEPQIVHEKVFRKKSKKSKHHHHHHHHHKRKRHHSPVMLITSAEEAPMKLTLKLRPTPSISPGGSSSRNKSPLPESPTKEKRFSISLPQMAAANGFERTHKHNSQKRYSLKITLPKAQTSGVGTNGGAMLNESACGGSKHLDYQSPKSKERNENSLESTTFHFSKTTPQLSQSNTQANTGKSVDCEKKCVSSDVKERLAQMRQVRIKSTSVPASPPPSPSSAKTMSVPDLTTMKTPSSLSISKIEAGETPQRLEELSNKPSLEILVLPPSPPPSDKQCDESEDCSSSSEPPCKRVKENDTMFSKQVLAQDAKHPSTGAALRASPPAQTCVLDLSADKSKRDPLPVSSPNVVSLPSPKYKPAELSPQLQFATPTPLQMQQMQVVASNPQIRSIHQMMGEATLATMKRMSGIQGTSVVPYPKLPVLPLYRDTVSHPATLLNVMGRSPPRRVVQHSLQDILGAASRPVGGFAMPMPSAARPGPNQTVRQIPNPSALLHRQKSSLQAVDKNFPGKQPGQLTEQQLKERLQQFQQNRAKAAHTYSRASASPASIRHVPISSSTLGIGPVVPVSPCNVSVPVMSSQNNNASIKAAFRPRSIEKVAGLLSVRAGSAYTVEAQAGH